MRVEIDTQDLVFLVKQFTNYSVIDSDLLEDIEELLRHSTDYDFNHEVEITNLN
jgi:hypothetical protein